MVKRKSPAEVALERLRAFSDDIARRHRRSMTAARKRVLDALNDGVPPAPRRRARERHN